MNIQDQVSQFLHKNDLEVDSLIAGFDLSVEVGELTKLLLKSSNYGNNPVVKSDPIIEELGDVAYSLLVLALKLDISFTDAVESALEKYQSRIDLTGTMGSN